MSLLSITPSALGRALLVLVAMAALGWLAVASWPALLPFVVGGVLAYIILPLVDVLDWVMPRFLAAFLGIVLVLCGYRGGYMGHCSPGDQANCDPAAANSTGHNPEGSGPAPGRHLQSLPVSVRVL